MGGIHERPVYRTELPIKGGGAWTICKFNGGGGARQSRGGEVNTPMRTMAIHIPITVKYNFSFSFEQFTIFKREIFIFFVWIFLEMAE